jgi:hypothetical protein
VSDDKPNLPENKPKIQLGLSPTVSASPELKQIIAPTVLQPLTVDETEKVVTMLLNIKKTEAEIESKRKFDEEELRGKRQMRNYTMLRKWSLFITGFLVFAFGFSCFFITQFLSLAIFIIGLGFSLMGVSSIVNLKSKEGKGHDDK